jgi:hypothetical protein
LGVRAATTRDVSGLMVTPHASLAGCTPSATSHRNRPWRSLRPALHLGSRACRDLALSSDATLGFTYSGQLAGDLQDNGVQGRLNWRF